MCHHDLVEVDDRNHCRHADRKKQRDGRDTSEASLASFRQSRICHGGCFYEVLAFEGRINLALGCDVVVTVREGLMQRHGARLIQGEDLRVRDYKSANSVRNFPAIYQATLPESVASWLSDLCRVWPAAAP